MCARAKPRFFQDFQSFHYTYDKKLDVLMCSIAEYFYSLFVF